MREGIVVKNVNGYFYVMDGGGVIHESKVRGRLKQGRYSLLVGDKVAMDEDGQIQKILPRHSCLRRPPVANVDQVLVVVAAHEPDYNELMLNRLLVMIEDEGLSIKLCINKWDLHDDECLQFAEAYRSIGYPVYVSSTRTGEGIEELRECLHGKITAFAGPSGVGKSSLLNAIDPNFSFQTGEISEKTKRGRHTTRHASLYRLDDDSYIMDTPGFTALDLSQIDLDRLPFLFPEFNELRNGCQFSTCTHSHEPRCAIKAAVESGTILQSRYDAYLRIRDDIQTQRKW